ncbi:MAG: hypothetical protein JJ992_15465 [Planctomycetes bacterium]|nr:hypothetical protein [Planctomycetota bacterium]
MKQQRRLPVFPDSYVSDNWSLGTDFGFRRKPSEILAHLERYDGQEDATEHEQGDGNAGEGFHVSSFQIVWW